MPKADTMARMQSTTLDHQKGNKLWVHDAVPRHYHYHPFSTQVSGITPEGRASLCRPPPTPPTECLGA